jgi:hypothetical protein
MLKYLKIYLTLWIGIIIVNCASTTDNAKNVTTSSTVVSKDTAEVICKDLVAKYKEYIEDEFNYCNISADCGIAYGTCPLGPFFIVNKEHEKSLGSIILEVRRICVNCIYDMPMPPTAFKCKNLKCYPAFSENLTVIMLFRENCKKIVSLYSEDIIGRDTSTLDLDELLYRVIPEDDIEAINSLDPYSMNRVRVIIDKGGMVKSLDCDR